jgi:hypothetical protein
MSLPLSLSPLLTLCIRIGERKKRKIVLAIFGRLDTSVCIPLMRENNGFDFNDH